MAEAPWSIFTHGQLHNGARLLLVHLWRTISPDTAEPFVCPSAVRLARDLGTDERTIRRRLEAAEAEGFIVRGRRIVGRAPRWGWLLVDPSPTHQPRPADDRSVIYYIGSKSVRRIKIGVTTRLCARFKRLSEQSIDRLEILAIEPGEREDEIARHELFAHLRRHGEWFEWTDELSSWLRFLASDSCGRLLQDGATPAAVLHEGVVWLAHQFPRHQARALRSIEEVGDG